MNGHYRRFLYRARRFAEAYPRWFSIAPEHRSELAPFGSGDPLRLNAPRKARARRMSRLPRKPFLALSEHETEQVFADLKSRALCRVFPELDPETLSYQLPVGLFRSRGHGQPARADLAFTGGKSAIDLWGISRDGATLFLFELKRPGAARKVGIISELFFYANLMRDVQNGRIALPGNEQLAGTKRIMAVALTHNLHPLLADRKLIRLMNRAPGIRYAAVNYQADFECSLTA